MSSVLSEPSSYLLQQEGRTGALLSGLSRLLTDQQMCTPVICSYDRGSMFQNRSWHTTATSCFYQVFLGHSSAPRFTYCLWLFQAATAQSGRSGPQSLNYVLSGPSQMLANPYQNCSELSYLYFRKSYSLKPRLWLNKPWNINTVKYCSINTNDVY